MAAPACWCWWRMPASRLTSSAGGRAAGFTPVDRLIDLLRGSGQRLGLVTNGEQWMLVYTPGSEQGGATSQATWHAELWLEEPQTLRAFRSLLRASRFFAVPDGETLEAMLANSLDAQHEVTTQLGSQVRHAVELLVQAIDEANQDAGLRLLDAVDERDLYGVAVAIMMRLVFLFAAEERGVFPLDEELYGTHYAATPLRAQLRQAADAFGEEVIERRLDAWSRLLATFRLIHGGSNHPNLHLPAYGGGLFDPDRYPFLEGRLAETSWRSTPARPLPINNRIVLHVLEALQLLQIKGTGGDKQTRRLSFKALDVQQIGDVYEGLLDHTAKRATEPVLGLAGTKGREPEIALATLEAKSAQRDRLLDFLKEETGRSESALKKALDAQPDFAALGGLRAACGNDEALLARVLPFAGIVRADEFGRPAVIGTGSVYVTAGSERRATGTHYTPRSLTQPIVQHTLDPLVYHGPAEGLPEAEWRIHRPAALLGLKVCDMAMGSGAFLVEVTRYLAARLLEALDAEAAHTTAPVAKARRVSEDAAAQAALAPLRAATDPDERLLLAKRLVAERCLYGVDKNPAAVELAKLALWLETIGAKRPFSFLDHALKCGDSLVGVDQAQLIGWSLTPNAATRFEGLVDRIELEKLVQIREKIEAQPVVHIDDALNKTYLLAEFEAKVRDMKWRADMLVASYYNELPKTRQAIMRAALLDVVRHGADVPAEWHPYADLGSLRPFHWPLEFPEVFLAPGRSGFDAFVGNPPFLGGKRITMALGTPYRELLNANYTDAIATADLCALFFLRSQTLLSNAGTTGLIATNTISQGDTRQSGLDVITDRGGIIFRARSSVTWPGQAAVSVSVVHIAKGQYEPPFVVDGTATLRINSFLAPDNKVPSTLPYRLVANANQAFKGHNVYGQGFILDEATALALHAQNGVNRNVVLRYMNGDDLTSRPDTSGSRWVVNFRNWPRDRAASGSWLDGTESQQQAWLCANSVPSDHPGWVAEDFSSVFAIVELTVKPERATNKRPARRERWWIYGDYAVGLESQLFNTGHATVVSQTAKHRAFVRVPVGTVFDQKLVVFPQSDFGTFANLHRRYAVERGAAAVVSVAYIWRITSTA
jgi:hypothetical protein